MFIWIVPAHGLYDPKHRLQLMLMRAATDRAAMEPLPRRYRTVFISDVHLGSPGCKADCLIDFLRHVESDQLYLVGDIVDGWRLQKRWFWPDKHAEVLSRLLARARPALDLPGPVYLYVGRVAVEKNLEAFLDQPIERGSKLVVGDGLALERLRARYKDVHLVGGRHGAELARHYVCGDVFVFPSRTDTFGLVLLEGLASGVPAGAYPVPGPLDVIESAGCGVLDDDLGRAMSGALAIPRERCLAYAGRFSWRRCAEQFVGHLHRIDVEAPDLAGSTASA